MWEQLWSRIAVLRARVAASGFGQRLAASGFGQRLAAARARFRVAAWVGGWRRRLAPGVERVRRVAASAPFRRRRARALYHDGRVTLDERGIVIHAYYVPFGAKRIGYAAVVDASPWPLTGSRAFHARGPGWPRVWYQGDPRRGERDSGILIDVGRWWRPVATPAEPAQVLAAIRARIPPPGSDTWDDLPDG